jgi:hypothetical protein
VPEAREAIVEKLKDYIQARQILLFVVYERSLKSDCNQKFHLNTNFTKTLLLKNLLKNGPNYSTNTCIFSPEDVVAGEMLSVGKL